MLIFVASGELCVNWEHWWLNVSTTVWNML